MLPADSAALEERAARMRELVARGRADEVTWFGLGQTLLALGRPTEAADALREAVRRRAAYTAAHRDLQTGREIAVLLARCARAGADGSGEPTAAAGAPGGGDRAAEGGARRDAASLSASQLAARQLAREALRQLANGRSERAIALYERAIAADPSLAIAWNGLSVAWRQQGDLARAVEAGRRLAALEPDDPLSHTNLSILYQSQGRIPEAEEEKALAMRLQLRAKR